MVQMVKDANSPNCQVCGQVMTPNRDKDMWRCKKCSEIRKSLLSILNDYNIGVYASDNQEQAKEVAKETVDEIMGLLEEHFGPDHFYRLKKR